MPTVDNSRYDSSENEFKPVKSRATKAGKETKKVTTRRSNLQTPLETYLREINETKLLTAQDEKDLARAIALGRRSSSRSNGASQTFDWS